MQNSRFSRASVLVARSREGMSLVEIMVVIAIIGVLMTVVAVNVLGSLDDANAKATRIQIKKIEEQLVVYAADHKGKFPSSLEAIKKKLPNGEIPKDAWDNDFQYASPGGDNRPYDILSYGKDGQPGGSDANTDITSWQSDTEAQ
jgi:general secretion pathway protein G